METRTVDENETATEVPKGPALLFFRDHAREREAARTQEKPKSKLLPPGAGLPIA
jgi:hypothetical protein